MSVSFLSFFSKPDPIQYFENKFCGDHAPLMISNQSIWDAFKKRPSKITPREALEAIKTISQRFNACAEGENDINQTIQKIYQEHVLKVEYKKLTKEKPEALIQKLNSTNHKNEPLLYAKTLHLLCLSLKNFQGNLKDMMNEGVALDYFAFNEIIFQNSRYSQAFSEADFDYTNQCNIQHPKPIGTCTISFSSDESIFLYIFPNTMKSAQRLQNSGLLTLKLN